MLYDDIDQPRREPELPEREGNGSDARPIADREVPIRSRATPRAIHAWLDGDLPEAAVRHADLARDVEFWQRLNQETDARRHMRTPVHVYEQIMQSLPQTTPTVITPWWRRPFALTPMQAAAVGAGVLAMGAAIAWLLR
jgi:hypothetical protein